MLVSEFKQCWSYIFIQWLLNLLSSDSLICNLNFLLLLCVCVCVCSCSRWLQRHVCLVQPVRWPGPPLEPWRYWTLRRWAVKCLKLCLCVCSVSFFSKDLNVSTFLCQQPSKGMHINSEKHTFMFTIMGLSAGGVYKYTHRNIHLYYNRVHTHYTYLHWKKKQLIVSVPHFTVHEWVTFGLHSLFSGRSFGWAERIFMYFGRHCVFLSFNSCLPCLGVSTTGAPGCKKKKKLFTAWHHFYSVAWLLHGELTMCVCVCGRKYKFGYYKLLQ